MIPLKELVRMPKDTTQTYLLDPGDETYFLKKLATYCSRAKASVEHDIWLAVRMRDDTVRRLVVCRVIQAGEKRKRRAA